MNKSVFYNVIKNLLYSSMLLVFLGFCDQCLAQAEKGGTYRVVAISKGDTSFTSISNSLEVHPQLKLFLPNAFTPNGDGLNDTFGVNNDNLRSMQLLIFDRWGQLVFESKDPNEKWDGTVNGQLGQNGVYAYTINLKGNDGSSIRKDGSVLLIN